MGVKHCREILKYLEKIYPEWVSISKIKSDTGINYNIVAEALDFLEEQRLVTYKSTQRVLYRYNRKLPAASHFGGI